MRLWLFSDLMVKKLHKHYIALTSTWIQMECERLVISVHFCELCSSIQCAGSVLWTFELMLGDSSLYSLIILQFVLCFQVVELSYLCFFCGADFFLVNVPSAKSAVFPNNRTFSTLRTYLCGFCSAAHLSFVCFLIQYYLSKPVQETWWSVMVKEAAGIDSCRRVVWWWFWKCLNHFCFYFQYHSNVLI